ncbi:hypothetical protein [Nocardia testacea]
MGVTVLGGDEHHEPGTGENYLDLFLRKAAWHAVLDHPRRTAGRG